MKENYTQDNLNNFFEEFKNLPNSYKIDQVHHLVNNPHAKATHSVKFYVKHLKFTIMTSTILLGIIGLYLWLAPENSTSHENIKTLSDKSTVSNQKKYVDHTKSKFKKNQKKSNTYHIQDLSPVEEIHDSSTKTPHKSSPEIPKYSLAIIDGIRATIKKNNKKDQETYSKDSVDIEGIRLIELTKSEYINLGFTINLKTISHTSRNGDCVWEAFLTNHINNLELKNLQGILISKDLKKPNSLKYVAGYRPIKVGQLDINKPNFIFMSDINGTNNVRLTCNEYLTLKWNSDYFKDNIQELVPIVFRQADFPEILNKDHIFWFEPSPELFQNLPERISKDLEKEYYALMSLKQTRDKLAKMLEEMEKVASNSKQQKENQAQDCYYFEGCRSTLDIEKLNTYPNPSQDKLNVEFSLQKNTKGSISLISISGQLVKSLNTDIQFVEGLNTYSFNVSDLESGVYLLKIVTPDGFKTQRIIISR